ncbi:helix-turn-helix domain-containing protein [Microbacterium mitrae]
MTWFWIPQWQLPPDESSRQDIVAYPALNLVVDPTQVTLAGATTRASHRELRGHGWAVGALLRPAAVAAFVDAPAGLVDTELVMDAPDLHVAIAAAMVPEFDHDHATTAAVSNLVAADQARRDHAVAKFSAWLLTRVGSPPAADLHANGLTEIFMGDDFAHSVAEAAERLAVSSRTLQRIAHRYVGLPPAAMIRRRRLQEAADRVRCDPTLDLAALANELGYADHAHLTRDFTLVLGMAPTTYRKSSR